jgi:hypothetical protein
MLLVSDASVLIDMKAGGVAAQMFCLPHQFVALDIVFERELSPDGDDLLALGLEIRSADADVVLLSQQLEQEHRSLSAADRLALAYAMQTGGALLSGDRSLVRAARAKGVEARGTLWLVAQLVFGGHLTTDGAREAFEAMLADGSFLPEDEIEALLRELPKR